MSQIQNALPPYVKRQAPEQYARAFFDTELGNIARAIRVPSVRTTTVSTTAETTDYVILANPAAGAITVTLPDPARALNMEVTIKQITSNAHAVTIGATVDGSANPTLSGTNKAITVVSDGAAWWKIGAV